MLDNNPNDLVIAAGATAEQFGVAIAGSNGVIGALAAVAIAGLPHDVLPDPAREVLVRIRQLGRKDPFFSCGSVRGSDVVLSKG